MLSNPETIQFLRCPETGESLRELSQAQIELINQAASAKNLTNRIGESVEHSIDGALVNESETWIYCVRDGIISLIPDEALPARFIQSESHR